MNQLIQQVSEHQLLGFFLVLARIGPLFAVAPMFSSKMIPARAKGVCAVALSVGIAPVVGNDFTVPTDVLSLTGALAREALIGLAFAFSISILFAALQAGGSFLDTLIGFSYGSLVDPLTGNQVSVLSNMYGMIGLLVFIAIDGDHWVIEGLARTYDLVPITANPSIPALVGGVTHVFFGIFLAALEVAAPVLLALVLTDAGFGVVSRVVPQLNVFAVGFSIKIAVGLLVIGVSLPFMGGWIGDQLQESVRQALGSLKVA